MKRLEPGRIREALLQLTAWRYDAARESIAREFKFADFAQAFTFMTEIALAAEKRDHHPEWSNVYNRVSVVWTTHDAGGLTEMDLEMARLCDATFMRCTSSS